MFQRSRPKELNHSWALEWWAGMVVSARQMEMRML